MTTTSLLAMIGSFLDLFCIITVIFVERKNPASTIAWLLVLLFLPFIGFVAYAMFGSGFHIKKKRRYAGKLLSDNMNRRDIVRRFYACIGCPPDMDVRHSRIVKYMENDGAHFLTTDNAAELFTDGEAMFEAMKRDMRAARQHIHLLYYIFRNDALGREILEILTEKARASVDVRVIYDSLGSFLSSEGMFRELRASGGKVEAFSPLMLSISSHLRLNYRNHRKITVIDGVIGYVGGMNIGEEYLGRDKKLSPWRDTHLRLTGSSVNFLEERFLLDWFSVNDDPPDPEEVKWFMPPPLSQGALPVQIVSSGPDSGAGTLKSGLLEMLYSARKRVLIQTPYFTPDDSFLDALRIAACSGVDVRLMLPGKSDNNIVHAATYSYARQALGFGVKVFRYNGFLHAKTVVTDHSITSIGTANIDYRSFSLNFEINAFIYNEAFARRCEAVFTRDLTRCTALDEEWFARRNPLVRAAFGVTRLFAPLM